MKRKIAVALVLVLVLTITVGVLTGCDEIFKKNDARDAAQGVATVNYDGQTAYVYKSELSASFNSYAYLYVTYYDMSYEQAADYILQSLAQRKLLVLFAKSELTANAGIDKVPSMVTLDELLSRSEINRAVENTNEDMLSALNTAIQNYITEDNYNKGDDEEEKPEYEEYEGDDVARVYFDSQGGSTVSRQKIQIGTTAFEPDNPTREGYTFYGWYTDAECTEKFDFATKLTAENLDKYSRITLYAKWAPYTAPRPVMPEEEEDKDADYDPDDNSESVTIAPTFFDAQGKLTEEYRALIVNREVEIECLKDYSDEEYAEMLNKYLDKAAKKVADDMSKRYTDYNYYLGNEKESLLITKLERVIGNDASVNADEVQARFNELVAQNKESFANSDTSYESALKSALSTTYYHPYNTADKRYGFVANILLKLPEEDLKVLTQMATDGVYSDDEITAKRDELLKAMEIKVSNPDYDENYDCDKHTCEDGSACDPMTCPNHECNQDGKETATSENAYNQIVSFEQVDGKWTIVYNVKACPEMAYLKNTVPAFDKDGKTGIVNQIYNSFEQVTAAVNAGTLTHVESVYWIREIATAWLYLVGDDTGSTSSDSNNGGLGYLVTPEGKDSGYIDSFTEQARALIKKGTGSYTKNGDVDGSYVFGDSFIGKDSTDGAYAGIFILVATCVPYDTESYTVYEEEGVYKEKKIGADAFADGVLPLDYIMTYGETLEDCKTIRDIINENMLNSKKSAMYEQKVNAFGLENYKNINYNKKAYESLWKDLD